MRTLSIATLFLACVIAHGESQPIEHAEKHFLAPMLGLTLELNSDWSGGEGGGIWCGNASIFSPSSFIPSKREQSLSFLHKPTESRVRVHMYPRIPRFDYAIESTLEYIQSPEQAVTPHFTHWHEEWRTDHRSTWDVRVTRHAEGDTFRAVLLTDRWLIECSSNSLAAKRMPNDPFEFFLDSFRLAEPAELCMGDRKTKSICNDCISFEYPGDWVSTAEIEPAAFESKLVELGRLPVGERGVWRGRDEISYCTKLYACENKYGLNIEYLKITVSRASESGRHMPWAGVPPHELEQFWRARPGAVCTDRVEIIQNNGAACGNLRWFRALWPSDDPDKDDLSKFPASSFDRRPDTTLICATYSHEEYGECVITWSGPTLLEDQMQQIMNDLLESLDLNPIRNDPPKE